MKYMVINNNYVDQSEIRISKNKLITSHLGTCSAILFSLNNNNFLGHIDAIYNNEEQLIEKIKNNFNIKELKKINIYVISGEWCNKECKTFSIIKNSLEKLGLNYRIIKNIKWRNMITIDKNNVEII